MLSVVLLIVYFAAVVIFDNIRSIRSATLASDACGRLIFRDILFTLIKVVTVVQYISRGSPFH